MFVFNASSFPFVTTTLLLSLNLLEIAFADPCAMLFLSSSTQRGDLRGASGADTVCTNLYNASSYLNAYKSSLTTNKFTARVFAWLTDGSGTRPLRIAPLVSATDPVCVSNPLRAILHSNLSQLLTPAGAALTMPPNVDELGETASGNSAPSIASKVWTGSRNSQVSDCRDWLSSSTAHLGFVGDFASAIEWASDGDSGGCANYLRLYCLVVPIKEMSPTPMPIAVSTQGTTTRPLIGLPATPSTLTTTATTITTTTTAVTTAINCDNCGDNHTARAVISPSINTDDANDSNDNNTDDDDDDDDDDVAHINDINDAADHRDNCSPAANNTSHPIHNENVGHDDREDE
jgi:hypothetical protein